MSTIDSQVMFDFSIPSPSIEEPATPPDMGFSFDPSFLELPYNAHHSRSASQDSSLYSFVSGVSTYDSTADSVCSRLTTPPRAASPVRQHGPLLLPKIRSQDHDMHAAGTIAPMPKRIRKSKASSMTPPPPSKAARPSSHARSFTNPESLMNGMNYPVPCTRPPPNYNVSAQLLCSPASFIQEPMATMDQQNFLEQQPRRASSYDVVNMEQCNFDAFRQMPWMDASSFVLPMHQSQQEYTLPSSYTPRAASPQSLAGTPEPTPAPSTTVAAYLSAPNPAASLVRSISFPLRDPNTKHFWWDIRSVKSWTGFNASTIFSLPGVSSRLTSPIAGGQLSQPTFSSRQPETEASLHAIYASYYIPKLNAALAAGSSSRTLKLSVSQATPVGKPTPANAPVEDLLFVANAPGDSSTAAAMFGGKPSARIVGLVRSFDRFNSGMRNEGNIKRVEYLRGLAALHHAMREHGCRYGFIMTEIELIVVRNGVEAVPVFGELEVASFQLSSSSETQSSSGERPLSACLALWGLCQLALAEDLPAGHASWRANIGAPAEGTRRKAKGRDSWMPAPQLAEKRAAKRSRGWVWPEDAIGRKELGKRGVRYGGVY